MTLSHARGPMLHPRVAVLRRPSGAVQLGWDPEHAVVLDPPDVPADAVLTFVRLLDGLRSHPQILWEAGRSGVGGAAATGLLRDIDTAGLLVWPHSRRTRVRSVHVHGRGPLADTLSTDIRRLGIKPTHTHEYRCGSADSLGVTDLVLLTDALVPSPELVSILLLRRIPHLQVRIRDGHGVIGPLVLPGGTSCLRCADLTRTDFDAEWPHLAAQLLGRTGYASPATISATAALALREVESIIDGKADDPPRTLDTTLELDPTTRRIAARNWIPHEACACRRIEVPAPEAGEVQPAASTS
ncbi:TOMM precursor leader peptide-binding protein [Nocardia sp. NPDC052254]|uniref:TOMM precursor leader peptide-binding protein n=1 Tax=Nocardia sp. NPDC052254 TaxID=3155681 RepID=UPI003446E096